MVKHCIHSREDLRGNPLIQKAKNKTALHVIRGKRQIFSAWQSRGFFPRDDPDFAQIHICRTAQKVRLIAKFHIGVASQGNSVNPVA